jgi:AraC-like DNA-binding protein/mannose-6-phosphate isomerase-like protein (cupin superfamily)
MMAETSVDRSGHKADHAALIRLPTGWGVWVELMRTSYRTQVFPKHTHDYYTLGVVRHGVGTLWHRGAVRTAQQGDVVVIGPGEVHTGGVALGCEGLSYLAVHVPPELFARCSDEADIQRECVPTFRAAIIRDRRIATELCRLDALARSTPIETGEILIAAIGLLLRRYSDTAARTDIGRPPRDSTAVRVVREIIEDCYGNAAETSLEALAAKANVSACHLVRTFTQTVGLSPHRYLVQTRVRRASELLARGCAPSFAAAVTGFADQSHLTTQFKRYMGMTPGSYQRGFGADER